MNAELLAEAAKVAEAIAGAVVGEHMGDGDAETGVIIDGSLQESGGRRGFLIGQDLGEGDAGVVVDGDVHILPAGAMNATAAVAGDAATDGLEATDLLDIEVEQIAGGGMFVRTMAGAGSRSRMRLWWSRRRMRLTVARLSPVVSAMCSPVQRWRRNRSTRLT